MRAFVITAPGEAGVQDVPEPVAVPARSSSRWNGPASAAPTSSSSPARWRTCTRATPATRCGSGTSGAARSPRSAPGVDGGWLGRRVTGDTMIGCGHCRRCRPGASTSARTGRRSASGAAGRVRWPSSWPCRHGAARAAGHRRRRARRAGRARRQRAARRRGRRSWRPATGCWCSGPGTIGLLVALFAPRRRAPRCTCSGTEPSLEFARSLGVRRRVDPDDLPALPFDAVVDASNAAEPAGPRPRAGRARQAGRLHRAGRCAEPGRHPRPRPQGRHRGRHPRARSPGLAGTIDLYAGGAVDPRPLVAATVGLDEVGRRPRRRPPAGAGPGPKIHVDPRA